MLRNRVDSTKEMNQSIQKIIQQRFSCRRFTDEPIQEIHQHALKRFLESLQIGPLGTHTRFTLVAATSEDRKPLKGLSTYGLIKNPPGFFFGAYSPAEKALEDYGYLLEKAVLTATDLGLGTCWVGGPFTKSRFAKKIALRETETIPAIICTGSQEEQKNRDGTVRKYVQAKRRLPMEELFFENAFGHPLELTQVGNFAVPLEMVRWAPSASNKQPWRIVRSSHAWHFYLQRTKSYGKGTLLFNILQLTDLQRIDMGIAMCHFELTARELGLHGSWTVDDPHLSKPDGSEYTVSWISQ
jgi:nitroreductase